MDNYKFIYKEDEKLIVGEIKNKRLIDYKDLNESKLGNIYRARVKKFLPSLDAYLLDIGEDKDGLLRSKNRIKSLDKYADTIVEVIKDPKDHKMYELSEKYTLASPYQVLKTNKNNKLENTHSSFSRTRGKDKSEDFLKKDLAVLLKTYEELEKERNFLPSPKLLYRPDRVKDYTCDYPFEIISNLKLPLDQTIYDPVFNPAYTSEISLDLSLRDKRLVENGDVSIVIDQLEALTVIDVNYKNVDTHLSKEDMSLSVNLKALKEIAIQISLRKIKKMLIIDFLRMNKENRTLLVNELKKTFGEYKIKNKIQGFSNMGFLEIVLF